MIRFRALHRPMRWLAVMAVALMLCAPPVSRWLLARTMENPMCTADGMMAMSGGVMPPMDGAMRAHGGHAGDAGHAHPDHGDIACDYCVIVASLLPVALVLLGLLPWRRPVCPPLPARRPHPPAAAWPACSARGPPLAA